MLSFGVIIYFMLSFNVIIFDVIIWCYHLVLSFGVIIHLMLSFDVIVSRSLQMLSFLCYHFSLYSLGVIICYHLMLSFFVIISPLFSFSWKRDTLLLFWIGVMLASSKESRRSSCTSCIRQAVRQVVFTPVTWVRVPETWVRVPVGEGHISSTDINLNTITTSQLHCKTSFQSTSRNVHNTNPKQK